MECDKVQVASGYMVLHLEQQIPQIEVQTVITLNLNKNITRDAADGNNFIHFAGNIYFL